MPGAAFDSFSPSLIDFLEDLTDNNDRDWFKANKARYESEVVEPALAFIGAMEPRIRKISKHFEAIPKKTGGSMMRIYRDTRFSNDKTPYKTNVGIQFRHERGKNIHAPGFYLHIEPDSVFLGVGLWRPERDALADIRQAIAIDPKRWKRVCDAKAFAAAYELGGDTLVRPPKGYDEDHPMIVDLKRKDFIATATLEPEKLEVPGLPDRIAKSFKSASAFIGFLCEAIGIQY
ncbi:MAG: DUF2461 domain-containing protein [Acidobacteriota bacterium]|nr:DUF2461 domain-containing protein [Acidobacteriota bacterium]